MPSVTVRSKNNPHVVYTYDFDNLIFDRSRIAMAFVGKQMKNESSSDVIIQVYNFSNISEIWKRRLQYSIVNFAKESRRPFIDVFFDDASNCSREYMYLIREFHQEITLEDFLSGKNLNNFNNAQNRLYQKFNSPDRAKVASDILLKILSEVQYLNDLGIWSIDIHPSAVLVKSEYEIELLDFGITKLLERNNNENNRFYIIDRNLTEYEAPEEIVIGSYKYITRQTDVYAIGILYFQLITGNLPFKGALYEVLQSQLRESVPIKQITHPTIRTIIKKATEKDIKKRYDSCSHFIAAIEDIDFAKKAQHSWWQKIFK